MGGCAAPFCNNSSAKGYIMKIFPRNAERRALWAKNVGRLNWTPTNNSFLCEIHFAPEMWEARSDKRKLKLNAIPTIFGFYLKKEKPMDIENITPESTENNTESYHIDAIQTVNDIKQESIDTIKGDPFFNDDQVINDASETIQQVNDIKQEFIDTIEMDQSFNDDQVINDVSNVESASSTIQQVNDIKQEFIDTIEMDQSFNDDQMINDVSNVEFTSSTIYPALYTKCEENDEKRCKKLEDIIQRQHINMFKMRKKIKALRFIIHTLKKKYDNDKYKKALYSIFTKCQIEALFTKKRSIKFWSHETIVRALQLKFLCGTNGYEELIRQGIPLPSVRTLRRKLQNL